MIYKILPRSLFGIMMLFISLLFVSYTLITGSLSWADSQRQQNAYFGTQIENALIKHEASGKIIEIKPENATPASLQMRKIFKKSNKSAEKRFALFYNPNDPSVYWLHNNVEGWIPVHLESSLFIWIKHFAIKIILMIFMILFSALLLTYMIKKPLTQLTQSLVLFQNKREISPVKPTGPKELKNTITAVNNMMNEINSFEQQRQLVLAGVAHDICTPLARIRLSLEMIPELEAHKKQALIKDIDQINYLQQQFLNYINIKQKQVTHRIDLAGLLESCAEQYPEQTITLALPDTPIYIEANSKQLQRAFDNVFANALQHGLAPVEVVMKQNDTQIEITITDHGPGVPEELLPKIMQPLYRGNTARSNCEGTGLGLSIFNDVIQSIGGSVEISNAVNAGLQVRVLLLKQINQ
jgi:signal transduction histidine kinase